MNSARDENNDLVGVDDLSRAAEKISLGGEGVIAGVAFLLEAKYRFLQENQQNGNSCSKILHSALSYLTDEPYITLGIDKDADDTEIKRAYRTKALKFHPDKNSATSQLFTVIQSAYDLLTDSEKRQRYDSRKRAQAQVFNHGRNPDRKYSNNATKVATESRPSDTYGRWAKPREVPTPRSLRVVEVSNSAVTIEWSFNDPNEMPAAFHLQWRKRGVTSQEWQTAKAPVMGTSVRKKNLESGTYYEFRVRAANALGLSQFSEALLVLIEPRKPGHRGPRRSNSTNEARKQGAHPYSSTKMPTPPRTPSNGTGYTNRRRSTSNIQGSPVNSKHKFHWIRLITLGSLGSGKTCLVQRYCSNQFRAKYIPTCGVDSFVKGVNFNSMNKDIKVSFWDLSGHPEFESIRSEFYGDVQGIIMVFDVTDHSSFVGLDGWLLEAQRYSNIDVPVIVCGNKIDQKNNRHVRESEARQWAIRKGFRYFEVSALSSVNVQEAFHNIIEQAAI